MEKEAVQELRKIYADAFNETHSHNAGLEAVVNRVIDSCAESAAELIKFNRCQCYLLDEDGEQCRCYVQHGEELADILDHPAGTHRPVHRGNDE